MARLPRSELGGDDARGNLEVDERHGSSSFEWVSSVGSELSVQGWKADDRPSAGVGIEVPCGDDARSGQECVEALPRSHPDLPAVTISPLSPPSTRPPCPASSARWRTLASKCRTTSPSPEWRPRPGPRTSTLRSRQRTYRLWQWARRPFPCWWNASPRRTPRLGTSLVPPDLAALQHSRRTHRPTGVSRPHGALSRAGTTTRPPSRPGSSATASTARTQSVMEPSAHWVRCWPWPAFDHYAGADRTVTVWSLTGSGSTNTARLRRSTGGGRPAWTNVVAGAAASFLCHFCETRQPPTRRRPLEGNTGSIFQNG